MCKDNEENVQNYLFIGRFRSFMVTQIKEFKEFSRE